MPWTKLRDCMLQSSVSRFVLLFIYRHRYKLIKGIQSTIIATSPIRTFANYFWSYTSFLNSVTDLNGLLLSNVQERLELNDTPR